MFLQYPHKKSEIPIRHFVPNLITTISLCCGLASMHYTLSLDYDRAIFAVMLAAVFDALDGRAARLLKAVSPFGAVLDSLADFLSFGIAPAMLLYQWMLRAEETLGLAAVMTFVLCSALRLARFTAAAKPAVRPPGVSISVQEQRELLIGAKFFKGMPTPAAAATVLIPPMLVHSRLLSPWLQRQGLTIAPAGTTQPTFAETYHWAVIALTFAVALLMISRVPMYSFKKLRVSRRAVVPMLALVGLVAVLIVKDIWLGVPALATLYVLTIPLSLLTHRRVLSTPV